MNRALFNDLQINVEQSVKGLRKGVGSYLNRRKAAFQREADFASECIISIVFGFPPTLQFQNVEIAGSKHNFRQRTQISQPR